MSLASDEILLDLMPSCGGISRIIALSKLVDDPKSSNVTKKARLIRGRVHSDIENIIKYKPDLVIAASFNRKEVVDALGHRAIKTLTLDKFSTVEDITGNILKIGALTGCEAPSEKLREVLLNRVNAASQKTKTKAPKPTFLNYSSDLTIMGKNTLFNDIVSKAGGLNSAALQGLEAWPKVDAETLLKMNPDYLVVLEDESPSIKQSIKSHHIWKRLKAVQNDRFIFITPKDAFSTSHYIAGAIESLADAIKSRASGTIK
jgi:ABC-type Fe3+-hydroxamate transport system substrate-binding protein